MRRILFWLGTCLVVTALCKWSYDAYENTVNLKGASESLDRVDAGTQTPDPVRWPIYVGVAGVLCVVVSLLSLSNPIARATED